MDYPRYCTRATSAILQHCFSHCANQYLSFHTIISATLVRNISHIGSLLPPCSPERHGRRIHGKCFSISYWCKYTKFCKRLQDFRRFFLWPKRPIMSFKHKSRNDDGGENKTILRRNGDDDDSFYFFFFVFLFSWSFLLESLSNWLSTLPFVN